MNIDVVMPAGGRISGKFAEEAGVENKALISIGGQTILQKTLCTVRNAAQIGRCVVIGGDEIAAHPGTNTADAILPGGETGPDNIMRGLEWLRDANGGKHSDRVLVVTTDLPFLSSEAISSFVRACPADADICAPLIRRQEFDARFPNSPVDYVKLCDGEWTLGCVFLVNPKMVDSNRSRIDEVFALRKSQIGMARLLGVSFILKFLTHRLSANDIQERCQLILGCRCKAVSDIDPGLAFDIDCEEEYRYAVGHNGKCP